MARTSCSVSLPRKDRPGAALLVQGSGAGITAGGAGGTTVVTRGRGRCGGGHRGSAGLGAPIAVRESALGHSGRGRGDFVARLGDEGDVLEPAKVALEDGVGVLALGREQF